MQTFLPYPDYSASARCLDQKRLGKQRVECKQILLALGVKVGEHEPGKSSWKRHPAVMMWRGYEMSLCMYAFVMCTEWRMRGFKDTLADQFLVSFDSLWMGKTVTPMPYKPDWIGNEKFHASHRSNLLRKDRDYYGQFAWEEPDDLPYFWPVTVALPQEQLV